MTAAEIRRLALRMEPRLRRAFLQAMSQHKGRFTVKEIATAIEAGNVQGLLDTIAPKPGTLIGYDEEIRAGYIAAGVAALASVPNPPNRQLEIAFNARDPQAVEFLQTISGDKITEIIDDQRVMIQQSLAASRAEGLGADQIARNLIGRIEGGQRTGGVIGLHSRQSGYVDAARQELGDPALMRNYLTRKRRDRRFDSVVKRAIRDGRALSQRDIERITGRYADRLLQLRAETIARTETLTALSAGQNEAMRQLIQQEGLRPEQVRKVWRTASDSRVRDAHAFLNGDSVGANERFANGLLYPHDPSGSPEQVINCRCVAETRVDWLSNA